MRAALLLALLALGCEGLAPRYPCSIDEQCVSLSEQGGRCIARACAWPAAGCPSGYRYDGAAGGERVGQCAAQLEGRTLRFVPLAFPDGRADVPQITALFGAGYVAAWDGQARLYRLNGAALEALAVPDAQAPLRLGLSTASALFVATAGALYVSTDGGQRFGAAIPLAVSALAHDGQTLFVLAAGQVLLSTNDGQLLLPLGPPLDQARALFGQGAAVYVLGEQGGKGVLYRRDWQQDGRSWRLIDDQLAGYVSGWAAPAAPGYVLFGADGRSSGPLANPAQARPPRDLAFVGAQDLWGLWDNVGSLYQRDPAPTGEWRQALVDGRAVSYSHVLMIPAAAPRLLVASRFLADRTYRSRLWLWQE